MDVPVSRLGVFDEELRTAPIACRTFCASSSCEFAGIVVVVSGIGCRSNIGESEAPEDDEDEVTLSLRPECGSF